MTKSSVESTISVVIGLTEKVPIQVLHVDDEASLLKVAEQILEMEGPFEVEAALSVQEALKKMKKKKFDVIISDYVMPGKDGLQFLKELRDKGNTIPFIMFTGKGREEVAIKALNFGADRYLNKSGDVETVYGELAHSIRKAVKRERAEEALRESEERFRSIVENSHNGIVIIDDAFRVMYVNDEGCHIIGYSKEEIVGHDFRKFLDEESRSLVQDRYLRRQRGEKVPFRYEFKIVRKDREKRIVELKSKVIRNSQGRMQTIAQLLDVTERKKAEQALRESEEKYRILFDNAKDVTIIMDLKGKITSVNKAAGEYGFKRDEVLGKNILKFVSKKYWPKLLKELAQIARGKTVEGEIEISTPKGKKIARYRSNPMIIENKVVGVQTILEDITQREKAEEERNKLLRGYSERVKELHCLYGVSKLAEKPGISLEEVFQGTVNLLPAAWQYSDIACTRIVFDKQEFKTKNFKETRWKQHADIKVQGKRAGVVEVYYLEEKPTIAEGPFLKEERTLIDAIAERLGRIAEHKKAEEALRESEEKYRNIIEQASDSMITANMKGVVTSVNNTFIRLTGFSKDEIVGKHFTKVGTIRKRDLPMFLKMFTSFVRGEAPKPFEVMWKHKDGTTHPTEIHVTLVKSGGKTVGFQAITMDITERKKAEEELQNSEERLNVLFEFAPDAYYLNDLKGNFVDGNKVAEELTGYNRSELIGKSFLKLKLLPRKQVPKAAKLLVKNVLGKRTGPDEFILNRKDGTQVPVEIRTIPVKIKGQTLVLGIARDISERKRAETALKMMNEKLRVVGRLTRHDIRNKLTAVTGNVFLAKQKLSGDHEALKYLEEIKLATSQIEKLFDFARIYEKLGIEELAYMDVEKSVRYAFSLLSGLHGVQIVNDCRGLTVLADSLLRQLFYNLIHNSLKHGERVSQIRVYYEETGEDQLKLIYEDDGVGIFKAEKEKIFKEGYGKGTGYGLYLIRKMCEVYGWSIRETGKQRKGAQFTITISKLGKNGETLYKLH